MPLDGRKRRRTIREREMVRSRLHTATHIESARDFDLSILFILPVTQCCRAWARLAPRSSANLPCDSFRFYLYLSTFSSAQLHLFVIRVPGSNGVARTYNVTCSLYDCVASFILLFERSALGPATVVVFGARCSAFYLTFAPEALHFMVRSARQRNQRKVKPW